LSSFFLVSAAELPLDIFCFFWFGLMNRTFSSLSLQFRQNHKTPVRSVNDLYVVPRTFKQVKKDQALLPSSSLSPLFLVSAAELPLDISCLFWFGEQNFFHTFGSVQAEP
jgi:hypothetical protein